MLSNISLLSILKKLFRFKFPLLLLLALVKPTFAQKQITGRVLNSQSTPVELANVLLFAQSDTTKLLKGTVSDSLGKFQLENIEDGRYLIKINFIGFKAKRLEVEKITQKDLDLGTLMMANDATLLEGIEVVGQRSIIQKTNTGFIINAETTLSQQGGTAIDLLRNTPTVFVDAEGAVSLRGKAPLILINGRNSKLTNLGNIPASSIARIEIITNPNAQYDAEAENGIINIVFKKGTKLGTNGAFGVGLGYGERTRFNSSALLNRKTGNWNIGLGYDNRFANRNRRVRGDRVNFNLPTQYFLTQRRSDNRDEINQNIRFILDYENQRNVFNFEAIHSIDDENNFETLFSTFETQNRGFTSRTRRFSEELRKESVTELALTYKRKFPQKSRKLQIDMTTSFGLGQENTNISTQDLLADNQESGLPYAQRTSFIDDSNISNLRADYSQKIGQGTFETGYKGVLRLSTNDFKQENQVSGVFQEVANRSGVLEFDEQIHALYALYKGELGKSGAARWEYEVGLRAEQTLNNGKVPSLNIEFENQYFNLFPNISLGYKLTESQTIRVIYGRRINRPRLRQFNPYTDITDSLTQRAGNPNLQPELTDNFELTYAINFAKAAFVAKAYYRQGKNTIISFTELLPNGVLFSRLQNAGNTQTWGVESILSYSPSDFWRGNLSFSVFSREIDAGNIQNETVNNVVSWNTKWLNDFMLWKNGKLQIIGVYNSPTATAQGNRVAVYNVDLAFQQKLWKDKARIGLIVTDIFNTQESGYILDTPDFNFSRIFKVDTRAVLLTFAYTFGTKFKAKLMENRFKN